MQFTKNKLRFSSYSLHSIKQHVVDGLDECRIAWADQQTVPEEEKNGQTSSNDQPVGLRLDASHLVSLPSLTALTISPTITVEPHPTFRYAPGILIRC